jgi:2-dehydropantoate 2-reductase
LRDLDVACRVVTPGQVLDDPGIVIFAVKTYHLAPALAACAALRPQAVLAVANGVMKNEQLCATYGRARVLGCMANVSGELLPRGEVLFTRNVCMPLGPLGDYRGPAAADIAHAIAAAGVVTACVADIETVEWSKFVGWLAMFVLALVARRPTGVYLSDRRFAALAVRLIGEGAALAQARGVALADHAPIPVLRVLQATESEACAIVRAVGAEFARSPEHRMSSLQDLDAGRPLEVHETLGFAVREAERLGVAAPTLAVCYDLIAALDALRAA